MRAVARLGFCLVAALALLLVSQRPARAQGEPDAETKNAARDLARQARDAFLARDWERARDLYHRAYALVPAPTLAVREARALVELGRLVEAEERFHDVTRAPLDASSPAPFREAVGEAVKGLEELKGRIARVRLVVVGADGGAAVTVELDGKPVPSVLVGVERPIDPGDHVAVAIAPGKAPVTERFRLVEGATATIELSVAGAPAATGEAALDASSGGSGRKTWALVAAGVGVLGVGVGVQQGLVAVDRHGNLADACTKGTCPASSRDDLDAFRTARTFSTIGYVVGAVGLGAGAYLFLTAPDEGDGAALRPFISVGAVGVDGAF